MATWVIVGLWICLTLQAVLTIKNAISMIVDITASDRAASAVALLLGAFCVAALWTAIP